MIAIPPPAELQNPAYRFCTILNYELTDIPKCVRSWNCDLIVNILFLRKQLLNLLYQMKKMKQNLMKSKLLLPILLFVVVTVLPCITFAQSGFDNNGSDTGGVNVVDVPLDGGTVILIAAGVIFGVFRLYKTAQKKLALAK